MWGKYRGYQQLLSKLRISCVMDESAVSDKLPHKGKVPYQKAMQQVEYRKFEVIGNYPEYVLCRRDTASGESYLSCFSKRDIYFGTLGSEEVEDESR